MSNTIDGSSPDLDDCEGDSHDSEGDSDDSERDSGRNSDGTSLSEVDASAMTTELKYRKQGG